MAATSKKRKTAIQRYVPPDMIREIFLSLPCKSLFRFSSTCKLVNSFVQQDFKFMHEHIERNSKKTSHYLTWDTKDEGKLHVFELSKDRYTHVKIIQTHKYRLALPSVYGLVCLHGYDTKIIALLNPLSGQQFSLPDLPRPFAYETKNRPHAPQPTTWRHNDLGFGYDHKTDKYKIVQFVFSWRAQTISRCYVLTVAGGEQWRRVKVSDKSMLLFLWQPVYADGLLYWEVYMPCKGEVVRIFAFDLSSEKTHVIQSPARFWPDGFGNGKHLTLLEGKLCCVDLTPPVHNSLTMTIWELFFYNDSFDWVLSYKLDIYDSRPEINPLFPLYMDDDKRIVCESLGDLYRYDLEKKSLEVYPITQKIEGVAFYPYANLSVTHSEKIVSPIDLW